MSDTQEDVRLMTQREIEEFISARPRNGNSHQRRAWLMAKNLLDANARLAAYEALGTPEYLAALVEERDAKTRLAEAVLVYNLGATWRDSESIAAATIALLQATDEYDATRDKAEALRSSK